MSEIELPESFGGMRLNAAARKLLSEGGRVCRLGAGDFLWRVDDLPKGIYVLIEGRIRMVRERGSRIVLIHTVEDHGTVFGEVPLFAGTGYPVSAVADCEVTCMLIDLETLRRATAHDPSTMEALARSLSRRIRLLIERIETNTLLPVRARLASFLLGNGADEGGVITVPFGSQQALADRLGTVREVIAREIVHLRNEGILEPTGRGRVRVLDQQALDRIAAHE